MVGVAQLVEHRIVAPGVVGSIPIVHPIFEKTPGPKPGVFVPALYHADVVKLVDTPDLGSGAARCESSSLSVRTIFPSFICPAAPVPFPQVTSAIRPTRMHALDSGPERPAYVCATRNIHASFC